MEKHYYRVQLLWCKGSTGDSKSLSQSSILCGSTLFFAQLYFINFVHFQIEYYSVQILQFILLGFWGFGVLGSGVDFVGLGAGWGDVFLVGWQVGFGGVVPEVK